MDHLLIPDPNKFLCLILIWVCKFSNYEVVSQATSLTNSNLDMTLASNELVIINFYANWCRFSNVLTPIYDEAADKVREKYPEEGRVVMGKVDCEKEGSIATRFHITKYPTLKVIKNGQPARREYRGQRSVLGFLELVENELADTVIEFTDLGTISSLDPKKRHVIGYFPRRDMKEYNTFRRISSNLKDDCQFHAGFGLNHAYPHDTGIVHSYQIGVSDSKNDLDSEISEPVRAMHPPEQPIVVFRPDLATPETEHETYNGSYVLYDEMNAWITDKCVPLVREITFENAEELTEEGLPFLILFYKADDLETVKLYKEIVARELISEKQNINFLTADGEKFAHPLHHLGKSTNDLPLIAIDSFRHMYLFSRTEEMTTPGKLKEFIQDLYSGKLHREFHFGADDTQQMVIHLGGSDGDRKPPQTTPPESAFKKLAPSKNRYTILKDEL